MGKKTRHRRQTITKARNHKCNLGQDGSSEEVKKLNTRHTFKVKQPGLLMMCTGERKRRFKGDGFGPENGGWVVSNAWDGNNYGKQVRRRVRTGHLKCELS